MSETTPKWQELSNYCAKHDQRYMRFLKACPICVGELLDSLPGVPLSGSDIPDELVPNKMYGPGVEAGSRQDDKPVQLSLF